MSQARLTSFYASVMRLVAFVAQPLTGAALHNSNRVRVLVIAERKILLQRTSLGTQEWSLPGGGIEKHEPPELAVVRETYEETGITLDSAAVRPIGQWRGNNSGKKWPQVNLTFYHVSLPKVQPTHITRPLEILEAGWFDIRAVPSNRSKTVDRALSFYKAGH